MTTYAIISVGGKQYRVREGERLLVDRLRHDEGKTFAPNVLLVGGDGNTQIAPKGVTVTVRVVGHVLGDKIRIGKYKQRTGYRRHTGHRSRLSEIEIQSIGRASRPAKPRKESTAEPQKTPSKPKVTAKPKAAAKKATASKSTNAKPKASRQES